MEKVSKKEERLSQTEKNCLFVSNIRMAGHLER